MRKDWKPTSQVLKEINPKAEFIPNKTRKDWVMVQLGEIVEIARGGSPRPIKKYITTNSNGINWIKIGDVDENAKYITKAKQKICLKDGVFLMTCL